MPESFLTTPRASAAVRLGAIAIGLAAIVLATRTTITSSAWVGRVFPGFVLLDNRVVASVGLANWSGTAVPGLYQSEVMAVNGVAVASTRDAYARVAALPAGTPERHRLARWRMAGYGLSLAISAPCEVFLYQPSTYSSLLAANMTHLGAVGIFVTGRLVWEYLRGASHLGRQRVRVVTLGVLAGLGGPGSIVLISALVGGGVAMNMAAFTPFLFALSVAYAIVQHDLFEIDAMVKRGAYYLVLTGAVGSAYVAAVVVFNLILRAGAVTESPAFPVVFTLAVLLLFNPVRTRLQAFVDRVFFGTRYDGARVLAALGSELAGTLQRDRIAELVRGCVDRTVPNTGTRLFVASDGRIVEVGGDATVTPVLAAQLAA